MNKTDWRAALEALSVPEATESNTPEPAAEPRKPAQKGKLTVSYERKGRGGKQATIISGFTLADESLLEIAATLKRQLATGGSARGGEILIQGDRRDDVARLLRDMGFRL